MPNHTHKQVHTLRTAADFKRMRQTAKRTRNQSFILNYGQATTTQPRLGIIITKRNVKLAVQRNRIRRQIKEWFRQLSRREQPAHDFIIIAAPNTGLLSNQELRQSLTHLYQKWQQLVSRA